MTEEYLYKSNGISITKYLVKIWDSSYSVRNIDSISIGKQNTNSYWIGAIASFIVFAFFVYDLNKTQTSFIGMSIYDALPPILSLIFTISFLYMAMKPKYYLKFRMSGSESRTFESREYSDLGPMKFAIERAIISLCQ